MVRIYGNRNTMTLSLNKVLKMNSMTRSNRIKCGPVDDRAKSTILTPSWNLQIELKLIHSKAKLR